NINNPFPSHAPLHPTNDPFSINNSKINPAPINTTEVAINKLTEAITAMMSKVNNLQVREPQRSFNTSNNNNRSRPPICYNCGNTGHLFSDCPRPRNRSFNNPNENNVPINN